VRNYAILAEIAVAKLAAIDQSVDLTEPFFDAFRSRGCPTADRIVKRLKLRWDELCVLCDEPHKALRLSALRHRRAEPDYGQSVTPEQARWALRLIGRRLGWRVTRFDYGACRHVLRRDAKRRGATPLPLPTVSQVERVLKEPFWQASCGVLADLPLAPVSKSPVAVLELTQQASGGVLPTARELEIFCIHNRISVTSKGGRNYFEDIEDRLEDPSVARGKRPSFAIDLPESEKRRRPPWTEPECVHALALYLHQLQPDEEVSEFGYQHFSSQRDDLPWYRSFPQHGGFTALLPKARALAEAMENGLDPGPTLLERQRQRQAEGRAKLWAEVLDADGHPPWEPEPEFDSQRALLLLAERRSDAWCAYLSMLASDGGIQASEAVEAGLAGTQNIIHQWRRELEDLDLVEYSGRGFEKRAAGPSTSRWRLKAELPDEIRRRAKQAAVVPEWSLMLEETCRAITTLATPTRFYPKELAGALQTSCQNIGARLNRLEALGAVERVEHRKSERGQPWLWALTEVGLRRLVEAKRAAEQ
jgi:DNA-binding MarR family transcriptional regulator